MSSQASSSATAEEGRGPLMPEMYLPPHTDAETMSNGPSPDAFPAIIDYDRGQRSHEAQVRAEAEAAAARAAQGESGGEETTPSSPSPSSGARHCWSSPSGSIFSVRGHDYLTDRKKIEHPSNTVCTLEAVQLFKTNGKVCSNVAQDPKGYLAKRREQGDDRFYLVINYQCGGDPMPHMILYFAMRKDAFSVENLGSQADVAQRVWQRFLDGDDDYKTARWKVIPAVSEGHWSVRSTIGQKPALLAKKLTHHWRHNAEMKYLEVDCDVASSRVATYLMGVVHNNARHIVVDLAFLVESQQEDELPECILGTTRLHRMQLSRIPVVDPEANYATVSRFSAEQVRAEGEEGASGGWFSGMMGAGMRALGYNNSS